MPPSLPTSDSHGSVITAILLKPAVAVPLALSLFLIYILYPIVFDPLRSIPGPFLSRFTRLWELRMLLKGDFEKQNIDLHAKHGSVVRLAPGRYSIQEASALKKVYGHGSKFIKSPFYLAFGSVESDAVNLFQLRDPHVHATTRRKVAQMYSMSTLVSYEQYVDNCNRMLISKLEMFAEKKQPVDVFTWMQYYAFDVIGEITVGKPFGMMERGHDNSGILEAIDYANSFSSKAGLIPEWYPRFIRLAMRFNLPSPVQPLLEYTTDRIAERKVGKTHSDRSDFLTKLIQLYEAGSINYQDVFWSIGVNIVAGSDTTAISLSAIVYYLRKHPACLKKLQDEIDTFFREGKMSDPITFKEAQDMPYLQAVIKESLRIHPATGQIMGRIVPPDGAELAGHFFPAGTCVGANSWTVHRNKEIYGEDADQFRPERWLGTKEETSRLDGMLFSFGQGSRTCIGKNISLLEMSKVIPEILRRFDLGYVEGEKEEWDTENFWFVKQKFRCRMTPRK